ncbi:MAG: GNVR domain-containing protein [Cyclobacterium sp.]|uniref:GNVR domain-containing protein n=1 Tax=Cyclobacterium sp. TaxID=1966343 RepID=UPI0039706374
MDSDKEVVISIEEIVQTIWGGRFFIIKIVSGFVLIGLILALLTPRSYTASLTFIPQVKDRQRIGGNLGGLASIAGINLDQMAGGVSDIPPTLYPRIIKSYDFKKNILETEINGREIPPGVSFKDYYLYHHDPGILSKISEYTIGLPKLMLRSLRDKTSNSKTESVIEKENSGLIRIPEEEYTLLRVVEEKLELKINEEDGTIELYFSMNDPLAAAQLVQKSKEILQNYVIDYRVKKAETQLDFILERYREKKEEFLVAQGNLASFRERNQNVISPSFLNEEERLLSEYNLVLGVYNELAKQVENAEIQVKEDTPNFIVIQSPTIPNIPSKPKRILILFIFGFLGVFFSVVALFVRKYIVPYFSSIQIN